VIDDSEFPKDGVTSPGVSPQYSGTLGKTGNCQIGVSVQLTTDGEGMRRVASRAETEQGPRFLAVGGKPGKSR
jgi:SRSO17 transposase